jgi:hypothetical protein
MIGQLPPFALSTPEFRFRALAQHAGRAALGGDRETALVCFAVARLAAGMLPPVELAQADVAARVTAIRNWLASLALPVSARAAATAAIDAIATGNRAQASDAIRAVVGAASGRLDNASVNEIQELGDELRAKSSTQSSTTR